MQTPSAPPLGAHDLLRALIDDAGLFPPAALALEPALDRHQRTQAGPHAWMLGRFIIRASRLDELVGLLRRRKAAQPLRLSVIIDSDPDPRNWFGSAQRTLASVSLVRSTVSHVRIEVLEALLPPLLSARESYDATVGQFAALAGQAGLRDLPIYLEVPRDARWTELWPLTAQALARARLGAKVRCGGLEAAAFPSIAELGVFLRAVAQAATPFKATAGLHHPIRHRDAASGFVMHGFLNLLAASALATQVDAERLAQVLAEEDARAFRLDSTGFTWREERIAPPQIATLRERFVSYGSCSLSEPIEDLTALGMLGA